MPAPPSQTLIFDADDTLWENNVVFERVIDDFVEWVAHPTLDPVEIRRILAEIEEANIVTHGYGSSSFLRSLAECFTKLTERPIGAAEQRRLDRFTAAFASRRIELLPDVAEVLGELADRHRLFLLTKGDPDEQQRKIDASGLAHHFTGVDIVPAKTPETYRQLVADRELPEPHTWMIGNSPKSDIIAARAAGLRAVFIPSPIAWAHEDAELDPDDPGILRLAAFGELVTHF